MSYSSVSKLVRLFSLLLLGLMLAACAGNAVTPSISPTQEVGTQATMPASVTSTAPASDLRPMLVEAVSVEIGQGSPIPVEAVVSGTWNDLCAQLARAEMSRDGNRFDIRLYATPAQEDCPADFVGLPFRFAVPLNMVEMPAGAYTAMAFGGFDTFEWSGSASGESGSAAGDLRPVAVEAVQVEVGVGSPIPVEVVVSGSYPDLCAQIAQVEQRIQGERIEISLLASGAVANCPPDAVGLPLRIAIPLNMVEMPMTTYTVVVNGVETRFDWKEAVSAPGVTEEPGSADQLPAIAYIGADGNVWVLESGGEARQITDDANTNLAADVPSVSYYFPNLSSDGMMVAYRRDQGAPVPDGMQYTFGLWVYNLATGEAKQVFDQNPAGFDWKPGTHLLAYGVGVDAAYFTGRGAVDSNLAQGILVIDVDSGDSAELVKPERGYALYGPVWSPDGRFLSFDELFYMEGRGPFAYYDFDAQKYIAWEKALGLYDWSPDGAYLVYDYLTYTANGTERIFLRSREGTEETQLSPDTQGYAYYPAISPDGQRVAYLNASGGPDSPSVILTVQAIQGGEPRELGVFESVMGLDWSPDGKYLIFSAGPYEVQQVFAVSLADGSARVLAQGGQPSVAGK